MELQDMRVCLRFAYPIRLLLPMHRELAEAVRKIDALSKNR